MQVKHVYFLLICSLLIFIGLPIHVEGATASREIKLSIFPKKELFDVRNMKPGDWTIRDLTVKNAGKKDISYRTTVEFKSGSEKLYEELFVQVNNQNAELFHGKLSDLNELQPRKLFKNTDETLTFKVEFPWELGNEFQNLKSHFIIKLFAVANDSGGIETPEKPQPDHNVKPPKETDLGNKTDQDKEANQDEGTIPPLKPGPNAPVDTPISPPEPPPTTERSERPDETELEEDDPLYIPEQEASVPDENSSEENLVVIPVEPHHSGGANQAGVSQYVLPNTATSIFNFLFGGGILIIVGMTILLLERRKRIVSK